MRCPYCGSNKIFLTSQNDGYSMKKGLIGAAVLGPVGAVAGIDGKTKQVFHCPSCNNDTHDLMNSATDTAISSAIFKKDVDSLKRYKAQYPNIEWEQDLIDNND